MSEQVRVEDLEVFSRFRAALIKFAEAADQSLSNADSEVASTKSWLEGEQATFWQGQLKKRSEMLTRAKDALRQKKIYKDATGRTSGAIEEEKIVAKCAAAVEEAQEKIEAVRKWLGRLEKEADLYRGSAARLSQTLSDIPKGVAHLDRLSAALEKYVQLEAPGSNSFEIGMAAGDGNVITGDAAAPVPTTPPASEQKPAGKEGGDGADGL